jgi:WD40 repeat protein
MVQESTKKYWAFISYSHADEKWATWLHKALERYRIPTRIVGRAGPDGPIPKRIFPIFRDREELPSASNLSEQVELALKESRYLIVICSPNAAVSNWVNKEIQVFKYLGNHDRILCLIVNGEPNASNNPTLGLPEAFPEALRSSIKLGSEPIAADVRKQKDGKTNAKLKLLAGILGISFDELKQRDRRHQKKRRFVLYATGLLVLLITTGIWFYQRRITMQQQIIAHSHQLTSTAQRISETEPEVALLLAIEALRTDHNLQSDMILRRLLVRWGKLKHTLVNHKAPIKQVSWSPDRRHLMTVDDEGIVIIWEANSGTETTRLVGHSGKILHFEWSPDGSRILTAGDDSTARVWETKSGTEITKLGGHVEAVQYASWSPDGKQIATASRDGSVKIWSLTDHVELFTLAGHNDWVRFAKWSPNGKFILTASDDGVVMTWEAAAGSLVAKLSQRFSTIWDIEWVVPLGNQVVIAHGKHDVELWDAQTGKLVKALSGHTDKVFDIECSYFRTAEPLVATASWDGTARVWNAETGYQIAVFSGHSKALWDVEWSPLGDRIVTAGSDNKVRLWEANTGMQLATYTGHSDTVWRVAWEPSGTRIVSASNDCSAKIWFVGEEISLKTSPDTVVWSPDGSQLLFAEDGQTWIWDVRKERVVKVVDIGELIITDAEWSSDGRRIAIAGADKTIRIWDVASKRQMAMLRNDGIVDRVRFSPDGQAVLCYVRDRLIQIWNIDKTMKPKNLIDVGGPGVHIGNTHLGDMSWSPDGSKIAATIGISTYVWDAENGDVLHIFRGPPIFSSTDVIWSQDNNFLFTDFDSLRVWDMKTGTEVWSVPPAPGSFNTVKLSPDGRQLLVVRETAQIWDIENRSLVITIPGSGYTDADWSPDGNKVITVHENTADIWDLSTGKKDTSFSGRGEKLRTRATWSPNGEYVATYNSRRLWLWPLTKKLLLKEACERIPRDLTTSEWSQYFPTEQTRRICP